MRSESQRGSPPEEAVSLFGGLLVTTCTNTRAQALAPSARRVRGVGLTCRCRSGTKIPWPRSSKAFVVGSLLACSAWWRLAHPHTQGSLYEIATTFEERERIPELDSSPAELESQRACLAPSFPSSNLPFSDVFPPHCVPLERLPPLQPWVHQSQKSSPDTVPAANKQNNSTTAYNAPSQHLSSLLIFMLQGRRLQLPSASFLVCKSSSRNHALVELSPTPASDTLARCTRSPIFSLPSPSWSAQQEGAEVWRCEGGAGKRRERHEESPPRNLATRHWPEFLINMLSALQSRADGDLSVEMM